MSIRALPPTVLRKLQSNDGTPNPPLRKRCFSESRFSRCSGKRSSGRISGTSSSGAIVEESEHQQLEVLALKRHQSLGRRKTSSRMFGLDNSIAKTTEQLGRIRLELQAVNEDLGHVVDVKRQLSVCGSDGGSESESSGEFEGIDDDLVFSCDLFELCRTAQQDLKMADLARRECKTILNEIESAWLFEEKDMVTRAGWLRRESENFEKMSPEALSKPLYVSPPSSDEDLEDEEDLEQVLRKYLLFHGFHSCNCERSKSVKIASTGSESVLPSEGTTNSMCLSA